VHVEYELEYGRSALAIHEDAIQSNQRVLIVDDVLATGGTMAATLRLVEQLGGKVAGSVFLLELTFLNGRQKLAGHPIDALLSY
jgi:adenine phosphoribosyltransferase